MNELLLNLGTLSLGGTVAVGALALTAKLSRRRYAARWRCWIWLLLCLRLAVPLAIQWPERQTAQRPIQLPAPGNTIIYTYQPPVEEPPAISVPEIPVEPVVPQQPVPPPLEVTEPEQEVTLFQAAAALWGAGAVGMVLWYLVSHLRFLSYLRRWGRPAEDPETIRCYNELGDRLGLDSRPRLRLCPGLQAPMLAGIFDRVLLLPEDGLEGDALRYSLLHELTHFKRRDIWLKTLALIANAVHWFNPVLWYMVRLVERDMELACDEAALRMLPREEHGAYGSTILDAVERLKAAH